MGEFPPSEGERWR